MTEGTSQGLLVVVAIVIFGIFVGLSNTLFGTELKTSLVSLFGQAIETVDSGYDTDGSITIDGDKYDSYDDYYNTFKPTDESMFTFIEETGEITKYLGSDRDVVIPKQINGKDVKIISGVKSNGAFKSKNLKSVIIPSTVTKIVGSAFFDNNLTNVVIPNSVKVIDLNAFSYNKLTEVTIPDSVTTLGIAAFSYNKLTNIEIPSSVTEIGIDAFINNNLTKIEIPTSVTSIGKYAFSNNELTNIEIPTSVTSIGDYAFSKNLLTYVDIKKGTTYSSNSFDKGVVISIVD